MNLKGGFVELDGFGRIPFTDAKLPQTLEVTAKDIKNAKCEDPRKCVLACGAKRTFGKNIAEVIVYRTVIHVVFLKPDSTYESVRYALTERLRKAVSQYDSSKGKWNLPVGIYKLEVPSPTSSRGGRVFRGKKHGGKGGVSQKGIMQAITRRLLGKDKSAKKIV